MNFNHTVETVLILALFGLSRASAQTESFQSTDRTEEIVELSPFVVSGSDDEGYRAEQTVVGSRTAKNLRELPASVGIINLALLEDAAAVDVHEVFRYGVSGVTQNQAFNNDVNIRGFRGGGTLRNGNLARSGSKHYPLFDVERVEVLKGPAAMLNGSNGGIGGTINYFTRRPTETRQGEIKVSVNSAGRLMGQINASGPLVNNGEEFRLNYRATVGIANSDEPHTKDLEWEDERYFSAAFAMFFGRDTSLTIEGSFDDNNTYLYLLDFLDISVPADPDTGLIDAKLNQYSTKDYSMGRRQDPFWRMHYTDISATFLHRLTENANLRAVYNYTRLSDFRQTNRGRNVRSDNYTVVRQNIRNNHGHKSHGFQFDYQHTVPFSWGRLENMVGADGATVDSYEKHSNLFMPDVDSRTGQFPDDAAFYAMYPTDYEFFVEPHPSSAGPPSRRGTDINRSLSYYFQENLSFWEDRIILTGGLRWFDANRIETNLVTDTTTIAANEKFKVHKYGAVVKVLPNVSLYYTDAQNVFLAPSGNTDLDIQGDKLGEPYRDSLGKLEELGVKFDYKLTEHISTYGSAAVFKMEQTNIRTFGILRSGEQGLIQSAKDSSKGWEADLGLKVQTDSGVADLIFTAFNGDSAIADDEGEAYVRQAHAFVPWKYSIYGRYSWTSGALRNLKVGGGFEIEDEKRNGEHLIERPLIADAFIGYTFSDRWNAQLNLSNITNERYIIQIFNRALVQTNDEFRAKLTLGYRW